MAALCVFLAAACSFDYRDRRVPNGLILLMAAVGMAWRFWGGGPWGAVSYAGKAALLMALLYPFFKIASVGAGDVKLLGVTAGYMPPEKILVFLFCSLLIAAIISLLKMWKENSFGRRLGHLFRYLTDVAEKGSWQRRMRRGPGSVCPVRFWPASCCIWGVSIKVWRKRLWPCATLKRSMFS